MEKINIIIITSRFPYPLEKGDKLRIFHQIKDLSKHYNLFLISINVGKKINDTQVNNLKKFCKEIHIINISIFERIFNLIKAYFLKEPLQVGYFYSIKAHHKIKKIVKNIEPHWIYSQLIRTSKYAEEYDNNVIDYMDTFSKGIERRINQFPRILQPLIIREFKITQNFETKIFDQFKHHTIITENDRNFINHKKNNTIKIVPNGVDTIFFKPQNNTKKKFDLVFVGNMNYPPNIEAAIYLCKKILPLIEKKTKCTILIGGATPHLKVLKLAAKNIEISGWVEDIRDIYAAGKIFVAPMFIGTGLQNKLLEAMSMGIPCITTELANRALLANKSEIIIKNNAQDFANACVDLLSNKIIYKKLSDNGRKFVLKNYHWKNMNSKLKTIFDSK
ncbi:MAG: hypothetical protein CMP65_02395 [Flavobacteriales bacterium]|nr:hypothetical protein [Flavobacteriales bacterium]|tara:strand:+ start:51964 stop:53133 length:1170 start_codon:yes stop_codon:yes gene_type:complete